MVQFNKENKKGESMNNKLTYIFGHKNPDTDSICSAIGLSYLKNEFEFNKKK